MLEEYFPAVLRPTPTGRGGGIFQPGFRQNRHLLGRRGDQVRMGWKWWGQLSAVKTLPTFDGVLAVRVAGRLAVVEGDLLPPGRKEIDILEQE